MKRILFTLLWTGSVMSMAWAQTQTMPEGLHKVMQAHGGLATWQSLTKLSFTKGEGEGAEVHTANLHDRRIRVQAQNHAIGFDGNEVWISPADAEFRGSPRFYHNLYFYFFSMPFVLADPGIYYQVVPNVTLQGKEYAAVKISYGNGVGDSPDDNYILCYDPATYQMEWLMYTVTFGKEGPSEKYSLIRYGEWEATGGVRLPRSLTWYTYAEGVVGEERSKATFTEVEVSTTAPPDHLFVMPADGKVSPRQ